jgi:hypothetical protein
MGDKDGKTKDIDEKQLIFIDYKGSSEVQVEG